MNPQLPPDWLNAFLDDELSPVDRAAADARLAASPKDQEEFAALQELDDSLRKHLVAPDFAEDRFLEELDRRHTQARQQSELSPAEGNGFPDALYVRTRRTSRIVAVTTAVLVLATIIVIGFVRQPAEPLTAQSSVPQVARVVRFVGQIETKRPSQAVWRQLDESSASAVVAGTKIRTRPMSLCEVETAGSGVLRLNENTELIVRKAAEIELVSGEFWCTSSGDASLTVVVPGEAGREKPELAGEVIPSFVCPSNSPTQWSLSGKEIRCLSLSDSVAELTSPSQASCAVEPGQWISIGATAPPERSGYVDRLSASAWQLPLLSTGRPDDPELQSLLQSMLANVGHAKLSSMYESQIRRLGPAGTIPLIAFVRSSKSLETPVQRHKAMQIVADLAPESARFDLEVLSRDNDPGVSQLAMAALTRLASRSKG